jgi:hypothetical protein
MAKTYFGAEDTGFGARSEARYLHFLTWNQGEFPKDANLGGGGVDQCRKAGRADAGNVTISGRMGEWIGMGKKGLKTVTDNFSRKW